MSREDWLRAARLALLHGGPDAVRIEKLARDLKVTKGSFYWHFRDRSALLEGLLREWEEEKELLAEALAQRDLRRALADFFAELGRRVALSESGEWPSDAAIFAWASVSPRIAGRANREERKRIRLMKRWTSRPELAEYVYMAYLGFLLWRRRVPAAARNFRTLAEVSTRLLLSAPANGGRAARPKGDA
ncbi:MAG TPA: helix-turn-helix domain-containing protein [Terriglobales bacterium]|nr:helix-turn-helix domain-containing protein [Terriglobales bacterium]